MNAIIDAELVHYHQQDLRTAADRYRLGRLAWPARRRDRAARAAGGFSRHRDTTPVGASVLAGRP